MERELDLGHNDKDENNCLFVVHNRLTVRTVFMSGTLNIHYSSLLSYGDSSALSYVPSYVDSARTRALILAHSASNSASRATYSL